MVTTDIGYACPTCGERAPHPIREKVPTEDNSVQINDEFQEFSANNSSSDNVDRPQIINHHASSQYKKRLQQRTQELSRPELEAPSPNPELAPSFPVTDTAPDIALPNPNNNEDLSLTRNEQALLHAALSESHGHEPAPSTTQHAHHTTAAERAEALLQAAASQPSAAGNNKNLILIVLSICIVLGGLVTAWMLARTPAQAPKSETNVSPSAAPSNLAQQERDKQRKADLNSLSISIESYKKNAGVYPTGSNISVLTPLTQTSPPYIVKIPNDPSSKDGSTIQYGYTSDGSSFTLSCVLENKSDPDTKNGVYVVKNNTSD